MTVNIYQISEQVGGICIHHYISLPQVLTSFKSPPSSLSMREIEWNVKKRQSQKKKNEMKTSYAVC